MTENESAKNIPPHQKLMDQEAFDRLLEAFRKALERDVLPVLKRLSKEELDLLNATLSAVNVALRGKVN